MGIRRVSEENTFHRRYVMESFKYWSMSAEDVMKNLNSMPAGLTSKEAALRLKKHGENVIKKKKQDTQLILFLNQFRNPIIIILIVATAISGVTGELTDALIIATIILASAVLSFIQEYSAGNAIEELRAKVQARALVLRDGKFTEISSRGIVPGDIVRVSSGSLIPADARILECSDFFVTQAVLTGESVPSEKTPEIADEDAGIQDRRNCVFMGTNVQSGSAVVLVTATGENTNFGAIAKNLSLRPPETEFERGVRHFGYLLTQIMLVLTLSVFAINVIMERPAIEALLFYVALAVGITPQLLPAIISITLSRGSRSMAEEGVIVRRLTAIENFGSMDVLCTDKTGTLTEGTIRLDGAFDLDGEASESVFRLAYLNASLQTGMENSLDKAVSEARNLDISNIVKKGEIPFDFTRERLSVIVEEDSRYTLITKGAFSTVLNICTQVEHKKVIKDLDDVDLRNIQQLYETWSSQGIRVLGIAIRSVELKEKYSVEDENQMVFAGFLLLFDHPKQDVIQTISNLEKNGVSLRVITGDNKLTAVHTVESVGIKISGVITGSDLMKMSDESLWNKVENTTVFAEVDPNQKERIILALKKNRHVVGYMGDGINDIPALHAADVSISVDNAVDVARESADFVLMEKSLKSLNRGIELGRITFGNTLKYILVTTSANFGNMFSMAGVSLFLPFLPLLPKQILLINFLTDFPAITIANDRVDEEELQKPRRWDIGTIRNFMFTFGFISSVFDYVTFAVLFIGFKAQPEIFQSGWFTVSVLTELLILMVMRTHKPFFMSRPAPLLLYSSIAVGAVTLILPYTPLSRFLNIEPVGLSIMAALIAISAAYIVTTEIAKHFFYRHEK